VDEALEIGKTMSADYLAKLPTGFYEPLKKNIVTMESLKKKAKIGDANVYDIEQLYARMLVISQNRDIRLSDLFKYELSVPSSLFEDFGDLRKGISRLASHTTSHLKRLSVPSSLFEDFGDLRKGTKANMLHKLAAFSDGQKIQVDALIVDGNEALYHTLWPKSTTLSNVAAGFVDSLARPYDTIVVFDGYHQNSIKAHERQRRAKGCVPVSINSEATQSCQRERLS